MGDHQAGKLYRGKMRAWETACRPHPGQTDARLRLGSGVGLSSITGCSFNLSLTRCIKSNGQQKQHPATSSSQSDSDTPTSHPSRVFALKNPALRTTERVLTSLGCLPNLPRLVPPSPLFPPANKPCSLAHCMSGFLSNPDLTGPMTQSRCRH